MHRRRCLGLLALTAALALPAAPAAQADAAQRLDAARLEREVVWYTAMNTPDAEPLRKAFRSRYPFLEVTILRQPGEKIRTRVLTEARAGRHLWDVVSFNQLDMDALDQEGLLAAYASPEARTGFPDGAVDPRGHWTAIYVRQYVIGYNTRAVRPADAPRTWQDLLDPRWKGRLAIDENEIEWYGSMLDYLGRDRGLAFMRALARQEPQLRRGHSLLSKLLVAGDFPLALVHAAEMEEEKKAGAPVEWVRTLDPIVTSPSQVGVAAKAPHPEAARLFADFLLSREGQTLIRQRGRVPARTDLAPAGAQEQPLKLHYVDPKLARDMDRNEREFREIFLKGR
jgi:iron(III) transport system substrate-binding protein